MKTSLKHLPDYKRGELQRVVEITREEFGEKELEKIVLFGSHARGDWVNDAGVDPDDGHYYTYESDFDILVVVAHRHTVNKRSKWHRLGDRMNKREGVYTPVTIIDHEIAFVNKRLREGSYFFVDILKEGILLYDSGRRAFDKPRKLTPAQRHRKAKEDFEHWFESATEFFYSYQFMFDRGSLSLSAFQLHQATERFYAAILLVYTGYKPHTHDLEKLRAEIDLHEPAFSQVFPDETAEEKRLFELLRRAYVDARYKRSYAITRNELQWLSARVKRLQELTEEKCQKRIESYRST